LHEVGKLYSFRDDRLLSDFGTDMLGSHYRSQAPPGCHRQRHQGRRLDLLFTTTARLDGAIDVTYYENGGILLTVMRRLMKA